MGLDHLHPRPVGRGAAALVRAAPEHLKTTEAGVGGELLCGTRLADSGFSGQQQEPSAARDGLLDGRAQRLQLPLASDEDPARQTVERVRRGGRRTVGGTRAQGGDRRERRANRSRRRRAILGGLREELHDEGFERRWHGGIVPGRGDRRGMQVLRNDRHGIVTQEGRATGDELVEHRAEGVEVVARVGGPAEGLLRGHVCRRADDHALDGEPGVRSQIREPEVAELHRALGGEPDVRGLQVAMDDATVMGVLEGARDLVGEPQRVRHRKAVTGAVAQQPLQVAARHVLGDDVGCALLAHIVDPDDVRVVAEAARCPRLAPDASVRVLVERLRLEEGERERAVEAGVVDEVDALRAALAEETPHPIASARERGRRRGRGHAARAFYALACAARNRSATRLDRTCVRKFGFGEYRVEAVCAECKTTLRAGARFCDGCGTAVQGPGAEASAASMPRSFAAGRYQVRRFLGEGAKKRVYLANDSRLERDVAIAVIKTEGLDETGRARVQREARAMGRLGDHPHIATVYDVGDDDGQIYIVSQFMAGGSVEDALRRAEDKRLPLDQVLRIGEQVCRALEQAHARGVIHRDLKPGNVWLTEDGTAKLGDFGLALALDRSRMTVPGMMVGTVAYMPPEQALGRGPDVRSDLYGLGAMLYELLPAHQDAAGRAVVAQPGRAAGARGARPAPPRQGARGPTEDRDRRASGARGDRPDGGLGRRTSRGAA